MVGAHVHAVIRLILERLDFMPSGASSEALGAAQVPQMIHFVRIHMLGYRRILERHNLIALACVV